jgi:hypothetical protein
VRVHLPREHALELERLDLRLQLVDVGDDRIGGALVVLGGRELEQIARFGERRFERRDGADDLVELGALAPELLRVLRLVPDRGILELPRDFF